MNDEGFVLLNVLIAVFIFSLLMLAMGQEINLITKIQTSTNIKTEALIAAVNTMEELKREEFPASGSEEKERFIIESQVREFSPKIYELTVTLEEKNGKEILSLQTLREK